MTDYTAFDALLLNSIKHSAPITYSELCVVHKTAADALAPSVRRSEPEGDRVVDRRLQALRKRGLITPSFKGWRLA